VRNLSDSLTNILKIFSIILILFTISPSMAESCSDSFCGCMLNNGTCYFNKLSCTANNKTWSCNSWCGYYSCRKDPGVTLSCSKENCDCLLNTHGCHTNNNYCNYENHTWSCWAWCPRYSCALNPDVKLICSAKNCDCKLNKKTLVCNANKKDCNYEGHTWGCSSWCMYDHGNYDHHKCK
jgi:hypothetical protein